MALESKARARLEKALGVVDEHDTRGPRLVDDARRLWRHVRHVLSLDLVTLAAPEDALELACYAWQLPVTRARTAAAGKPARTSIRDRAEQAAELLVSSTGDDGLIDEALVDRATRIVHDVAQPKPTLDESKVLADAINLDDFGLIGMLQQFSNHIRQGDGVMQLLDSANKREQYGYWDARIKDSFHFEPVRQIARKRLNTYRTVSKLLADELSEYVS